MAQRADDIRHDIADTRAAMTEQLAMLEARVWETVVGTCTSVEKMMEEVGGIVEQVGGIVENVKATVDTTLVTVQQGVASTHASVEEIVGHVQGTIEETVATVKRTLDLPLQVEQHPWPMVGGALLAGYILGSWDGGRPSAPGPTPERGTEAAMPGPPAASRASSARPQPQQGLVSGMLDQLQDEMRDEIASFQRVAVRAVMSTFREMFTQALATLAPHTASAVTKTGGQPGESPAQHPASMSCAAVNGVPS